MDELNEKIFRNLTEYKIDTKYCSNNKLSNILNYDDECNLTLYSAYMTKKDIKMFHRTKYGCVGVYKGLRLFEYKEMNSYDRMNPPSLYNYSTTYNSPLLTAYRKSMHKKMNHKLSSFRPCKFAFIN